MRVLVIEDNPDIAKGLAESLESFSYSVDLAFDGEQGLRQSYLAVYDVIILDLHLPGLSGIDIGQKIRAQNKTVRIIALSVEMEIQAKLQMLEFCDDYVCKPFSVEELEARIRALTRRVGVVYNSILEVQDLRLDVTAHKVTRSGREIKLRNKEFALLELFMIHVGMVLTRSFILEKVWDMHIDPFTNTVDVHISYLRKKVDGFSPHKLIHTIPGRGYKMSGKS
ncbi:MAG: response regulator transcription factor [Candidatus Magasanikbacteria bacterium]|nr:response regulator transcription factor [Candidatus Magasanikbacteria bacterium]